MRKVKVLLSLILVVVFIAGCSGNGASGDPDNTGEPSAGEAGAVQDDPDSTEGQKPDESDKANVDIDLTRLSATMLAAEVTNIYNNGNANIGKTIRVRGDYFNFYNAEMDIHFHYVLTLNEDDCCQEGFEFRLSGDHVYPDDYPQIGTSIEVTGVFSSYEELGMIFYYLATDEITISS